MGSVSVKKYSHPLEKQIKQTKYGRNINRQNGKNANLVLESFPLTKICIALPVA